MQALKRMRFLPTQLLEQIYFKTVISRVTYCIGVWGNCSLSIFNELENFHIKAGRIIHDVPPKVLDRDILDIINWETLGGL